MPFSDDTVLVEEKMDIVTCLITVDGNDLPAEYHVTTLVTRTGINKIPSADITIMDGEAAKQDFELSSSKFFLPGKKIHIEIGCIPEKKKKVGGDEEDDRVVFDGIIISNSQRVNATCAELSVVCKHEAEKMTVLKSNAHFKKEISAKEIAEELLQTRNALVFDDIADVGIKHEQVLQSNVSDWDFMISRIESDGLLCLIENGKVNIKKMDLPDNPDVKHQLVYGQNILEFDTDMDARTQSDIVQTLSWDFKEQKVVVTEENVEREDEEESGKIAPKEEMRTPSNLTEPERKSIARSKNIKKKLAERKGRVKYLGTTSASPGDYVELKGVGERFSGKILVSAIQHEYSEGCWITEATVGWSEQFFAEEVNPKHAASSTGQVSSIQGLQIGIVTGIVDDEYRVRVKLPMIDNNAEGLHARVATLDAGNKRGTYFRPEVDDEVIIGFINDDPSNPVILGMLHSSKKPSPLEPENENNEKGYVSRSGIKLLFNDKENSVKIETPGKRLFELNDNTGTISLKDDDNNKIVMEQSGITIEAAKDITIKAGTALTIKAKKISIKSDASFEAEGSTSTAIKSGGVTEIKGSIVKIN